MMELFYQLPCDSVVSGICIELQRCGAKRLTVRALLLKLKGGSQFVLMRRLSRHIVNPIASATRNLVALAQIFLTRKPICRGARSVSLIIATPMP